MLQTNEEEYLKSICLNRSRQEVADMMNEKFKTNRYNVQHIKYLKCKYGIKGGIDCRFKKKQIPHNYKPIGSEFVDIYGYTWIKIADPKKWVHKSRYLYEKKHGKIPNGYSIIFLDQDKTNFDLDNLYLIKNKDKLLMKNLRVFSQDKDITLLGVSLVNMMNKIVEEKRKCNDENIRICKG